MIRVGEVGRPKEGWVPRLEGRGEGGSALRLAIVEQRGMNHAYPGAVLYGTTIFKLLVT